MIKKLKSKIFNSKLIKYIDIQLKTKSFYGFEKVSIYDVFNFFTESFRNGSILQYSSALTFNFFLAIFPSIIFIFTLVSYIPIENFKEKLFGILYEIMPPNAFSASEEIIYDIINNQHGGLLSVGFLGAMFFATNGVKSLMEIFNKISRNRDTRSFILKRSTALGLTIMLSFLIFLSIIFIMIGTVVLNYLVEYEIITNYIIVYSVRFFEIIVFLLVYFISVSFLFHYAPTTNARNKKFITIGAFISTILSVISSLGFSFYVTNFSSYNKLYGSIGTLIVFLMWMYLNSISLLVGYELNASILRAKRIVGILKD